MAILRHSFVIIVRTHIFGFLRMFHKFSDAFTSPLTIRQPFDLPFSDALTLFRHEMTLLWPHNRLGDLVYPIRLALKIERTVNCC